MKSKTLFLVSCAAAVLSARAVDLSGLADAGFAEKYAFSTNRAALIETLKPRTKVWFVYSVLDAQTRGDLDRASALLDDWSAAKNGREWDPARWRDLRTRQKLLEWDAGKTNIAAIAAIASDAGMDLSIPPRDADIKPNTHPYVLDQSLVSFDAFAKKIARPEFNDGYRFLAFTEAPGYDEKAKSAEACSGNHLPDAPGAFDAILAYLLDDDEKHVFEGKGAFSRLTLDQLAALAKATSGTAKDVSSSAAFANAVMERLAPGADDDPSGRSLREGLLKRRLQFARTLAPALSGVLKDAARALLDFGAETGDYSRKALFAEYLKLAKPENRLLAGDGFVKEYLSAYRAAGADISKEYSGLVEKDFLRRIAAECDLLAGKSAKSVDTAVFTPEEFASISDRVELEWAKTNPRVFPSSGGTSLEIDVKNVPEMRIAIYVLDAFEACSEKGISATVDLDCAKPRFERAIDYRGIPGIVRHREKFDFPELAASGVYAVECSGAGVCSRALVRKGWIRAVERRSSAGHVFTVVGEDGRIVKKSKLKVDGTVFVSDESGEIHVPFAGGSAVAGRKIAIAGAGALAAPVAFEHALEKPGLSLSGAMPLDALVAGCEATALLRPRLEISGVPASVALLGSPRLTATFTDVSGKTSVKTFDGAAFSDNAEFAAKFTVPKRLRSVRFDLAGSVKKATDGEDCAVSASLAFFANSAIQGTDVEQYFMRKTSSGYILECRGRNGERIPDRVVSLDFSHAAFKNPAVMSVPMQFDGAGEIALGALADISRVSLPAAGCEWNIPVPDRSAFPREIAAAEGETVEIPVRDLLSGAWPGAGALASRVSLLAKNASGCFTSSCLEACSYSDGLLTLKGLLAGDYLLTLRTEGISCNVKIVRTVRDGAGDGIVSSRARTVVDAAAPAPMRIASATVSEKTLFVSLANASRDARVHVFASMTMPEAGASFVSPGAFAAKSATPAAYAWTEPRSSYISGRDIGESLRYIADRRRSKGRIGNMLPHPSLLLNPWTVAQTDTEKQKFREGDGWAPMPSAADAFARSAAGGRERRVRIPGEGSGRFSRDFLPLPSAVFANLRPDGNGVVEVDLSSAAGMQDVRIVAVDGECCDAVSLAGKADPYSPRDLRTAKASVAGSFAGRTTRCATVPELYSLFRSLSPSDANLAEFSFIAGWNGLSRAGKLSLYGKYACHELDLFIYFKDRAFFDSDVAPCLANKRSKQFIDKWLLGEDVSSWADAGAIDSLNAFERCLLAMRSPDAAAKTADRFARWCEEYPESPETAEWRLGVALDEMESAKEPVVFAAYERMEAVSEPQNELAEEDSAAPAAKPVVMGSMRGARAPLSKRLAKSASVRNSRRLYSPPEKTKEWVETHYWKRRSMNDPSALETPNPFWRDVAKALADGGKAAPLSANVVSACESFPEMMAAMAILPLGFEDRGDAIVFSRPVPAGGDGAETVKVVQSFTDPGGDDPDAECQGDFVKGRVYALRTIVLNPSAVERRVSVCAVLPSGAVPLGSDGRETPSAAFDLGPFEIGKMLAHFYFPEAGGDSGAMDGAVAVEGGRFAGRAPGETRAVVANPPGEDSGSWRHVSQKGSKGEVLAYLKEKNLANVDLAKIGWRMIDGDFAKKALAILDARGEYCESLWLSGLRWAGSFDANRVRQAFSRHLRGTRFASALGPCFSSSLASVDAEESGLFEHKEYWPIVNARAHAKTGSDSIPNKTFAAQYRAFLDTLAAKKVLSADDRLLAAAYLAAQGRIEDAREAASGVVPGDVETKMQFDYMNAYFAFCDGDVAKARALAEKWKDVPPAIWRGRFRELIAEADEIERGVAADMGGASSAPAVSIRLAKGEGRESAVAVSARNAAKCVVKAYPVDLEIAFTKSPFGILKSMRGAVLSLKPAWTAEVSTPDGTEANVVFPREIASGGLIVVAETADGRASDKLEFSPCSLNVQIAREVRQIRVRDASGRPAAGAYVKVYAADASGFRTEFHKDGYTDPRGAFDYASVSTDGEFKPAKYALLVQREGDGAKTLEIPAE